MLVVSKHQIHIFIHFLHWRRELKAFFFRNPPLECLETFVLKLYLSENFAHIQLFTFIVYIVDIEILVFILMEMNLAFDKMIYSHDNGLFLVKNDAI